MQKDYYKILQLSSQATPPEIKQAFRRLAMIYHPDRNRDDPYAGAKFNEVKEAYEVLINPARKELYLQERWYNQIIGRKKTPETTTPVSILRLCLELEKYVSTLDPHRMSKQGLSNYVEELIPSDVIEKLKRFNETDVNRQIITSLLQAIKTLPVKLAGPLLRRLENLAGSDAESLLRIKKFALRLHKTYLWNKYKLVLMLLFTFLICLLIYFTNK